jgi:hypothetical protein
VKPPCETVRVLPVFLKSHGSIASTSFACGPAHRGYVLVVTAKMHEPNVLVPAAVPSAEDNVKVTALFVKVQERGTLSWCSDLEHPPSPHALVPARLSVLRSRCHARRRQRPDAA